MTDTFRHIPARDGQTLCVLGDRVTLKGGLEHPDLVLAEVEVPPGAGTPLHRHASPEIFRVLSGELRFSTLMDDGARRHVQARAGDVISIPSGTPHGYANTGDAPALVLAMFDRSMESFFRAVGTDPDEVPSGPPGPEAIARVMAAASAHGIAILE
ncbi:MAG: cupin domain-containing protein [Geminicoccaceae bacterium]